MKKLFNAAVLLAPVAIATPLALSQDFSIASSIGIGLGSQLGAMVLSALGVLIGANLSGNYESRPAKAAAFSGYALGGLLSFGLLTGALKGDDAFNIDVEANTDTIKVIETFPARQASELAELGPLAP